MQICLRIFNGGISRLKHHLSRLPSKGVNPCSKVKDDVTEKVRAILASKDNSKEIHIPKKRKQYELKSPVIDTILPNRSLMDLETPISVTKFFPNVTQSTPSNLSDEENAERSIALFFFQNKLDFSVAHKNLYSLKTLQLQFFGYLEDQDHLYFTLCGGSETEEDLSKSFNSGKILLYVKRNKAISLGMNTSKVGIEVQRISLKECTYKDLVNKLVNDGIKLSKLEINAGFINGLPKKWLSFCQSLRNINHVKESELSSLFGKLKYEENLIDSIYETKKKKSLATKTPLSTAFLSTSIVQDFQDSHDDEEDTRSSQEYFNDLEEEYQERALLAKSKRFIKKGSQRFSSAKASDGTICHKCGRKCHFARDCFSKTSVPSYSFDVRSS
ncbi:retrovirus-related pol polyprotein from transposon TNT 1-94 [Tanacetum coccineum]